METKTIVIIAMSIVTLMAFYGYLKEKLKSKNEFNIAGNEALNKFIKEQEEKNAKSMMKIIRLDPIPRTKEDALKELNRFSKPN